MMNVFDSLFFLTPELTVLITALLVLLLDLFMPNCPRALLFTLMSLGLLLAAGGSLLLLGYPRQELLQGLLVSDDIAHILNAFILLTVWLCFCYSADYLRLHKLPQADFYVLALLSTIGMMMLDSEHHLIALYLGLELVSLPLYALAALSRTSSAGPEAAMKYFIMGAVASAILLYGMSLLYAATGQLDLGGIAAAVHNSALGEHKLLLMALVFMIVGIGFKAALVPFHMWAPDAYEGAPAVATLLIASAPKLAAFGMMLRLLTDGLADLVQDWQQLLLIMTLLSTAIGNVLALVQNNIKRLFAYSTVSHMGYASFGVLAATSNGYAAATYYVIIYALMSVGALGIVVLLSRQGVEIENIDDLRGLNQQNPWLAFLMMIILFSMAGIPPTVGFFTKFLVLKALVDAQMVWVAVYGLLFAVVGAFYSLRIIKVMYFNAPESRIPIVLPRLVTSVLSLNSFVLLLLGIFPSVLIALCLRAVS